VKIGLISDTHGLLRPEALEALAGVQHIIHAGDMPTLATQASCAEKRGPLVQIAPASSRSFSSAESEHDA